MLDKITVDRIRFLHPDLRDEVMKMYNEANEKILPKDVRLRFSFTYRSIEQQDFLYKQKPKVTNAKGGQSMHNYGLAFDIVLLYDKNNDGTFETASFVVDENWKKITECFKHYGWEWGGDWKTLKDYPHFQKVFKNTWQMLKEKVDKGIVTKEKIDGVEYVYPIVDEEKVKAFLENLNSAPKPEPIPAKKG